MFWLIMAVFKVIVWWLVGKSRNAVAKKLKDGDVADQQVRDIIIGNINAVKSNLDGLLEKDLSASIQFFKVGIEVLYDVIKQARPRNERGADSCDKVVSLVERTWRNLKLTTSGRRQLKNAKMRFRSAREGATVAFSNPALSITDRILAMQFRLMATVLETIDHPKDAVIPHKVCIEELNGLPVVQQCLKEQFKTGKKAVRGLFKKEKRREVITGVYLANRFAYRVRQIASVKEPLPQWPIIDTGKEKVDLLRDWRVTKILRKQGMENCSESWILGQDGEEEYGLNNPRDIATNSSGQYIVADNDLTIKVFDNSGKFVRHFRLPLLIDDSGREPSIDSEEVYLATDMNDNIYVLVSEESREDSYWIFSLKTADQHHRFRVRTMSFDFNVCKPSVSDNGKVVVLKGNWDRGYYIVDVYETDGQFYCSFGEQIFRRPYEITTVSNGRVIVMEEWDPTYVHIFSERGDYLNKFDLQSSLGSPKIAFHRKSEQVVVVGSKEQTSVLYIGIHTKDGEFVRSTLFHERESFTPYGIAVTTEGHIVVVAEFTGSPRKVTII